jgi:hypothetical protein
MTAVIRGGTSAVDADVDAGTKALKVRTHPMDVLGSYQIESISGTMAAGLAAGSTIYSCRWGDATRQMLLRRVAFDARTLGTAFTAGTFLFEMVIARSFSVSDSAQTSILPTGNNQKRKTSFGTTLLTDLRIANTGAITVGTRTLDAAAIMNIRGHVPATAVNYPMVSAAGAVIPGASTVAGACIPVELFAPDWSGEWPIVFVQNEGFIIRATVPATGTWDFSVTLESSEVAAQAF